jgi:hypothetical protein
MESSELMKNVKICTMHFLMRIRVLDEEESDLFDEPT